jgi:hypothetical protein
MSSAVPVTELAQLQTPLEHGVRCLAEREARVPPGWHLYK